MSSSSALEAWRRLSTGAVASLRGVKVAEQDRPAFHGELELLAAERMKGFCWLLWLMHVPLLARDITLDPSGRPAAELLWSRWLFGLHIALLLAVGVALVLFATLNDPRAR